MVQYFGERLTGFVFTEQAWVQSYGSRCLSLSLFPLALSALTLAFLPRRSPPYHRLRRLSPRAHDRSLVELRPKPLQAPRQGNGASPPSSILNRALTSWLLQLTGPVTILNWSFPRVDVTKEVQSKQLALALRDEVQDLEAAGIFAIQVDEPAIREGLPLRQVDWDAYLTWAVDSFKLATAGVRDATQTHSHFCYSDFNAIFDHIIKLDAEYVPLSSSLVLF